ncbi:MULTISPECIES: WD40 repeat domain-containing protein [unclassified Pseudofrankia]|nr:MULTISPECIES: WD40 repeat domain-containing protein [unclassified Pseudofrankia]MDT3441024.1 WD40 repeat domain-containing protein [Pseudofrankia sp. BMG5.37]
MTDPAAPRVVGRRLEWHLGAVWSVAFSPVERILASAGFDGKIQLWR